MLGEWAKSYEGEVSTQEETMATKKAAKKAAKKKKR